MTSTNYEIIGKPSSEQTPEEVETAAAQFGFVSNIQVNHYEDEEGEGLRIEVQTDDFKSQHKLRLYDGSYYEIVECKIFYNGETIDVLDAAKKLIGDNITAVVSRKEVIPMNDGYVVDGVKLHELPTVLQEFALYSDHSYLESLDITNCPLPITFGGLYVFFHELAHANDPEGAEITALADDFGGRLTLWIQVMWSFMMV